MHKDAQILFVDSTDALFQLSVKDIQRKVADTIKRSKAKDAKIVISTEAFCFPCNAAEQGVYDRIADPPTALLKYLNSGGWVGTVPAVIKMLQGATGYLNGQPNPEGELSAEELTRRSTHFHGDAPKLLRSNNQGTFMKLFMSHKYDMALDYTADVFYSVFSSSPQKNVKFTDDLMVYDMSIVSNVNNKITPAVVHYNGMSKPCSIPWVKGYCMEHLEAAIKRRYLKRSGETQEQGTQLNALTQERFDALFTFLDPQFRRVKPEYKATCGKYNEKQLTEMESCCS